MLYDSELVSISRTPVSLLVLSLDYCGRTFGVSPCTATGVPCYNTFKTCKTKTAYLKTSKDYKFTSADASLPFKLLERPYIKDIDLLPTEIKTNLTVSSRVKITLYDEPDSDIGIDPYVSQRSSVQGTFWKKLLARNTNYKGRLVKLYEGFLGLPETDFVQKFVGKIDNIQLDGIEVKIEIKDLLKSLSDIEVPPKLNIKLVADMTVSSTEATLTTTIGLDSPTGYIRLKDEIIYYTGVNPTTNQLTGLSRGYFGTTATEQKANDKVQKVRYYAPMNGFNILKEMLLTDAGISADFIDTINFDYWRDYPGGEVEFSAIVSEPTKLETLYFEIVDLLDCKSWVGEDLKITIRRNIPNEPGRAYYTITDDMNIIKDSANVDLNASSRFTRHLLYWDRKAIGKPDEVKDYNHLDIVVDADTENVVEYGDVVEKKIFCRWLRSGYIQEELIIQYLKNTLTRQLFRQRDAQPILTLEVELKDSSIKTGSYIKVSTDELSQIDGLPLDKTIFQAVKRQQKESKITLNLLQLLPYRLGFIAPNTTPAYDSATEAEREYCFITGNDGLIDGLPGYYIY